MTRPSALLLSLCLGTAALVAAPADAAAKPRKVAPSTISKHAVVVDGNVLVPLADLARATSCELHAAPDGLAYQLDHCRSGGVLEVDMTALKVYAKLGPGTAEGFDPQPDPPVVLRIGKVFASRKVIAGVGDPHVESGDPHIPLAEVARLMGGKLERRGKRTWIAVPDGVHAPLMLAG
jgi:hypothetical protein